MQSDPGKSFLSLRSLVWFPGSVAAASHARYVRMPRLLGTNWPSFRSAMKISASYTRLLATQFFRPSSILLAIDDCDASRRCADAELARPQA